MDKNSGGLLTLPAQPDREAVKVFAKEKGDLMSHQTWRCWKVSDNGQGVLDGEEDDYYVTNKDVYYNQLLFGLQPYAKLQNKWL
jgi:hypothetical protein